jgi:septum site-determining protein MinC
LRGRRDGLEVTLSPHDLDGGFSELQARLTERPSFFRGASAVVNFGRGVPSRDDLERLRGVLTEAGVELRGIAGFDAQLEALAREEQLAFETPPEELERRRALRPRDQGNLSEAARSLVADFAGARGDIAQRRRRGEASVPRLPESETPRAVPPLHLVESGPSTLYHATTLRGGQVLHYTGNIVVVGDVNPGAELIASGDVLVFGRLAGIAHAGALGDEHARIFAIDLRATQLRIATFIAADTDARRATAATPEVAVARDGRIAILNLDRYAASDDFGAAT